MVKQWIWKAFENIRKNPILYIPDVCMAFIVSLTLILIYQYTGAANLFQLLQSTQNSPLITLTGFLSEKWKELLISGVAFFFVTFIFGATTIVLKFTMFYELLSGKSISLRTVWKEKKGYFWPVVFLRIIIFILGIFSFALAILLSVGLYFFLHFLFPQNIAWGITLALGIILGLSILVYLKVALLFRYPIMFLKQIKNPWKVLRESNALLRTEPPFVISTAGVVILLLIIFSAGMYILNVGVSYVISFFALSLFATICTVLWAVISQLINITVDLWSTMYIFLKWKEQPKE